MEQVVTIKKFEPADLILHNEFIITNDWPFHSCKITEPKTIGYFSENAKTLIAKQMEVIIGYIRIEEFINGDSPLFDVRVDPEKRGQGIGEALVREATNVVFKELPTTVRFEGTTRADNIPMLSLFEKLGWFKESVYRKGWKLSEGQYTDAIGYSILREEWEKEKLL